MPVRTPTGQAFAKGPAREFGGFFFGLRKNKYIV